MSNTTLITYTAHADADDSVHLASLKTLVQLGCAGASLVRYPTEPEVLWDIVVGGKIIGYVSMLRGSLSNHDDGCYRTWVVTIYT